MPKYDVIFVVFCPGKTDRHRMKLLAHEYMRPQLHRGAFVTNAYIVHGHERTLNINDTSICNHKCHLFDKRGSREMLSVPSNELRHSNFLEWDRNRNAATKEEHSISSTYQAAFIKEPQQINISFPPNQVLTGDRITSTERQDHTMEAPYQVSKLIEALEARKTELEEEREAKFEWYKARFGEHIDAAAEAGESPQPERIIDELRLEADKKFKVLNYHYTIKQVKQSLKKLSWINTDTIVLSDDNINALGL